MTAATNLALIGHLRVNLNVIQKGLLAKAGGGQNGTRLNAGMNQFTVVASAGDSALLPAILNGEAEGHVIVINDTATSMNVFPAVGENMNSTPNASAAVPANSAAFFMLIISATNWRSATL